MSDVIEMDGKFYRDIDGETVEVDGQGNPKPEDVIDAVCGCGERFVSRPWRLVNTTRDGFRWVRIATANRRRGHDRSCSQRAAKGAQAQAVYDDGYTIQLKSGAIQPKSADVHDEDVDEPADDTCFIVSATTFNIQVEAKGADPLSAYEYKRTFVYKMPPELLEFMSMVPEDAEVTFKIYGFDHWGNKNAPVLETQLDTSTARESITRVVSQEPVSITFRGGLFLILSSTTKEKQIMELVLVIVLLAFGIIVLALAVSSSKTHTKPVRGNRTAEQPLPGSTGDLSAPGSDFVSPGIDEQIEARITELREEHRAEEELQDQADELLYGEPVHVDEGEDYKTAEEHLAEMKRVKALKAEQAAKARAEQDKPHRPHIPRDVRLAVWVRDGGKCVRCGSGFALQYDHIVPYAKGGSSEAGNLELLCDVCNGKKSDRIDGLVVLLAPRHPEKSGWRGFSAFYSDSISSSTSQSDQPHRVSFDMSFPHRTLHVLLR